MHEVPKRTHRNVFGNKPTNNVTIFGESYYAIVENCCIETELGIEESAGVSNTSIGVDRMVEWEVNRENNADDSTEVSRSDNRTKLTGVKKVH